MTDSFVDQSLEDEKGKPSGALKHDGMCPQTVLPRKGHAHFAGETSRRHTYGDEPLELRRRNKTLKGWNPMSGSGLKRTERGREECSR
jgi:hypothetical protein